MTSAPDDSTEAEQALKVANNALRMVAVNLPWLSPLVYAIRIGVDSRFSVAAVSQSGHVRVNPEVFAQISLRDATYIMAHELLHLALDTFSRETQFDDPETVNIAHDYIINDLLWSELSMDPPLGGLDLYRASEQSLEQIVAWMEAAKEEGTPPPTRCWFKIHQSSPEKQPATSPMSRALADAGLLGKTASTAAKKPGATPSAAETQSQPIQMDVIFPSLERELFPDQSSDRVSAVNQIRIASEQAAVLKSTQELPSTLPGNQPGNNSMFLEAVRNYHQPPWQLALQRWIEAITPGDRTYARPSRRGADRRDVVLPGRSREGWTLHIVLDTSGSMSSELAACLGAIAKFCEATGVYEVHILQCDTEVTVDEWIDIVQLANYRIAGYGGSDMSPAMVRLRNDPEVSAVVVITDGDINYPKQMAGCEVLWAITDHGKFNPPYGTVLHLRRGRRT